MNLGEQKRAVFSKISSQKTLTEGLPKFEVNPSFPSINNEMNPLTFLKDLMGSLSGIESLKDVVIETLSGNLDNIEVEIKKVIKNTLNGIISCDINPSIPDNLLHPKYNATGKGVDLRLSKIDFNNMFLMDPESPSGSLLYSDFESGVNSADFNSFLYSVIQSDDTHGWGKTTQGNDILNFKFKEEGEVNNMLNIRVSEHYSNPSNKLKLKDLNNAYIDSIDLLDMKEVLNKIIDNAFGSISSNQNRSKEQLIQEAKIDAIIDRLINQDDDTEIDDSYFEFNNDELTDIELRATNKKRGVKIVETTKKYESSVDMSALSDVSNILDQSSSDALPKALNDAIDKLANEATANIPKIDKYSVKLDFIQEIVKNLMRVIGSIIISPKITTILMLNYHVVHGKSIDDPIEFIMENRYLMKTILNGIRDVILNILLARVLRDIQDLALKAASDVIAEQAQITQAVTASLVGLPTEVLRRISGVLKR